MGGVVSCSRLELSLGGVKAQLESRDLRMRRVLWGLPINRLGMLSAMADNMGGKNHMTKLSASYLPLPYLATFYPTIVCLSSHGLIAY